MATSKSTIGSSRQQDYIRELPKNPSNYRPGISGRKPPTLSPNTKTNYRQRHDRFAQQSPHQQTFVGTSPATFNVKENSSTIDQLGNNGTDVIFDMITDVDGTHDLVFTGGSRKPSIEDEDRVDLIDDEDEYTDDEVMDDPQDVQKKHKHKDMRGLLGGVDQPANWIDKSAEDNEDYKGLPDPNAIDRDLVGRADIGVPNPKASVGLRAVGGATAGAAIGAAAGAASGATFGGIVLASVAVGAGIGTVGFGVGAAVGAGVGLIAGICLGIAYGMSSAKRAKADYLDTSQRGTVQRASKYGWLRTIMPKQLGRRVLRLRPTSRSLVGRAWNATKGCWKSGHRINMEDRGRNARASEAREDLRYSVASHVAYSRGGVGLEASEFDGNKSSAKFRETNKLPDWVQHYQKPIEALSDDEIKDLVAGVAGYPPNERDNPEKFKAYQKNRYAYDRQVYQNVHKRAVRLRSRGVRTEAAFKKNEGVKPWDFKTIGPNATPGSKEHEIFRRLPESMQQSLTSGGGVFTDKDTGNNVRIMYDTENDEVVMAFNGTGGDTSSIYGAFTGLSGDPMPRAQHRTNITNYAGGTPPSVKQAVAIGKAVREAVQNYNNDKKTDIKVVSTGHSRGGLLATVEAVKNKGKAVTFNPEGMGAGVRDYCGIYSNDWVSDDVDVTVYSTRNEFVSGQGWASGIGTAAEFTLGNLPLPTGSIGVPPVIIGKRRILPQAPGFQAHRDHTWHMTHLAGGAQPPRKARMRWGPEVDDPSLYEQEPDREVPELDVIPQMSSADIFKDRMTFFATPQGQNGLRSHPAMRKYNVKVMHLDLDEFERDLAQAADMVSGLKTNIDPDDAKLQMEALELAIGFNIRRQREAQTNLDGAGVRQTAGSNVIEEEKPIEQCQEECSKLIRSAYYEESLVDEAMKTETMRTKNYDTENMDWDQFKRNLAKYNFTFAQAVQSEEDIRPQAIAAISAAIDLTMKQS